MQYLKHTCYAISIAGDHIISCLTPGKLGLGWITFSFPCPPMEPVSPRVRVQREGLGLQEECMFNSKRSQFLI